MPLRILIGEKLLAILDDIALTERLQLAGTPMGIDILDHVILADARSGLLALASWLTEAGCTLVATEATGV